LRVAIRWLSVGLGVALGWLEAASAFIILPSAFQSYPRCVSGESPVCLPPLARVFLLSAFPISAFPRASFPPSGFARGGELPLWMLDVRCFGPISFLNSPPSPDSRGLVWGHPGTTLVPSYTHRTSREPPFQSGRLIQITSILLRVRLQPARPHQKRHHESPASAPLAALPTVH